MPCPPGFWTVRKQKTPPCFIYSAQPSSHLQCSLVFKEVWCPCQLWFLKNEDLAVLSMLHQIPSSCRITSTAKCMHSVYLHHSALEIHYSLCFHATAHLLWPSVCSVSYHTHQTYEMNCSLCFFSENENLCSSHFGQQTMGIQCSVYIPLFYGKYPNYSFFWAMCTVTYQGDRYIGSHPAHWWQFDITKVALSEPA